MKKLHLIPLQLLLLSVLSIFSHADEHSPNHWKSVFVGGASFAGKTTYVVNESGGSELGTSSDQAKTFADFAGELTYQSAFPLGASLLVEGTRYEYKTGGSDGELGLYLMPRLAHLFGPVEFWAGVGLGMMTNNLGGPNSETVDGVLLVLTNMTPVSFAWTPRAGIDVNLSERAFVGAQFSYARTVFSVPYTALGYSSTSGAVDCTRSWFGGDLRLGSRF